jgi:hypothetical protein
MIKSQVEMMFLLQQMQDSQTSSLFKIKQHYYYKTLDDGILISSKSTLGIQTTYQSSFKFSGCCCFNGKLMLDIELRF